jgi:hypothetical protein
MQQAHPARILAARAFTLLLRLETAVADRRFVHTNPGSGYRFESQPSRDVHMETAGG